MNQICASVRYLPFKAFLLSLAVHLVVLSTFIFTVPLSRVSFKPTFVFLGPILKQQDVGDISQGDAGANALLSPSKDPSGGNREDLFVLSENVGRRFIQGASRQPVSRSFVGTGEKIVMKSLFDMPADDLKQEQTGPVFDPVEAEREIAPYKPLGLFPQ